MSDKLGLEDFDNVTTTPVVEAKPVKTDPILDALMGRISKPETKHLYVKCLVYGHPGTGKTVFSATFPTPLIIDVERGAFSINNHPELAAHAEIFEYRSVKQIETLISYLEKEDGPFARYETIVIDSISELQKRDLDDIVAGEGRSGSIKAETVPQLQDYNVSTEHLRKIVSSLRDLNKHIVVTSHAKEEKDDNTGMVLTRPNITPKLAGTLAGIFDVVGYMSASGIGDDRTYSLQVHPTRNVVAKCRLGGLSTVIENPTFKSLIK